MYANLNFGFIKSIISDNSSSVDSMVDGGDWLFINIFIHLSYLQVCQVSSHVGQLTIRQHLLFNNHIVTTVTPSPPSHLREVPRLQMNAVMAKDAGMMRAPSIAVTSVISQQRPALSSSLSVYYV